jgi:hypothetical protein
MKVKSKDFVQKRLKIVKMINRFDVNKPEKIFFLNGCAAVPHKPSATEAKNSDLLFGLFQVELFRFFLRKFPNETLSSEHSLNPTDNTQH